MTPIQKQTEARQAKGLTIAQMGNQIQRLDEHQIDAAILITGDSDFVPAIQASKDAGVSTILYYSRGHAQIGALDELLYACDDRQEITKKHIDAAKRTWTLNLFYPTVFHINPKPTQTSQNRFKL